MSHWLSPLVALKTIFPFSPGKVANTDWFGSSTNMVKTLDAKMVTPITTTRKPHAIVIFLPTDSPKNGDDIL
jgi:hypothetical protein